MFSNLQIRPARSHRRKPSLTSRAGVTKRRVSTVSAAAASNVPSLSLMQDLFGAEFPEAFASSSGQGGTSRKTILDLPAELLSLTCDYLSKLDIKRLRLASQHLARNVDLRIDRVFISPNRANLACLKWVLEHPWHSNRVREIVWDDAQLEEYSTLEEFSQAIAADDWQWTRKIEDRLELATQERTNGDANHASLERDDFFYPDGRLNDAAKNIILRYDDKFSRAVLARNAVMMRIEDSYILYSRLYQEEQDLMKRGTDVAALEQALRSLPEVKRITLTSEVWRPWHFSPRYDTPYNRSLPTGFRKPTVWPWHGFRPSPTTAQEEHSRKVMSSFHDGFLPNDWRGYTILTSALLCQSSDKIKEFIIDAGSEPAGIPESLITHPNEDLERTFQLFRQIPFQRLHIVVHGHRQAHSHALFPPDYFMNALDELRHLTHLDLRSTGNYKGCLLLESIFPPNLPAQLKTLALRGFAVRQISLVECLRQMTNAQEITFEDSYITYHQETDLEVTGVPDTERLFNTLRDHYNQYEHSPAISRPTYTWIESCNARQYFFHRCRMVQEEINDFLYRGWDSPFDENAIKENVGWIIDGRDPDYKERAAKVMYRPKVEDDAMESDSWLPMSSFR